MDVALGVAPLAFKQLNIFSPLPAASVLPPAELSSRYYLRLMARDEPGVLAQITKILGERKISLSRKQIGKPMEPGEEGSPDSPARGRMPDAALRGGTGSGTGQLFTMPGAGQGEEAAPETETADDLS